MSGSTIHLGIFGYGFIAGVHADALKHVDGVTISAVCGPRREGAQAFAERHGIRHVFTSPDDLLALDGLDGVLVDSPDAFHHEQVLAAVRAGKHIFCEKPLARTVEEAREMYRAAADAGLRTVVGFSNRWVPVVNTIRSLLEHDGIGAITHVHGQAFNASLARAERPRFSWRTDADRTGTGILGDLGSHYIDLTHYLLGDIAEVCADLRTVVPELYDAAGNAHRQRVDDDVTLLLTLAAGAHGSLALSRLGSVDANMPVGRRLYLIDGRKGGIKLENGRAWLYRPDGTEQPIEAEEPQHSAGHAGALLSGAIRQMESFVRAVRGEPDSAPTFRDGLRCQEVLHAAVESSRTRQWQPVGRVPEA